MSPTTCKGKSPMPAFEFSLFCQPMGCTSLIFPCITQAYRIPLLATS